MLLIVNCAANAVAVSSSLAMQIAYAWQALTLQASPFKKERTLDYVVAKMNSYSSLSSAELEAEEMAVAEWESSSSSSSSSSTDEGNGSSSSSNGSNN